MACFEEAENGRWDENIITADILRALKLLHKEPVKVGNFYRSISWNAYKLKGSLEQTHGDIALIVKIHLEPGKSAAGVAFLEAKKITHGRSLSSGSFSSIKWDRLREYAESSPAHYTIFYDYLPINNGGDNIPLCKSIVTSHLLALNKSDRSIYRHTENMSNLLGYRLLMGYGLDHRDFIVNSATGFSLSDVNYKYVITADITVSPSPELMLDIISVEVNSEKYEDISGPEVTLSEEPDNDSGPSWGPD